MADNFLHILALCILIVGLLILYSVFTKKECKDTVTYKYLPRTFEEEQKQSVSVSALYADMFLKDTTHVR
jgi:hypothetical protein